jgi:SdrD B-like domain
VVNNSIEVKGKVWNDLNANGSQDSGEMGLSGQTVFLDSNQNGSLDAGETTATTNAEGNYSFTNLAAGRYTVGQVITNN